MAPKPRRKNVLKLVVNTALVAVGLLLSLWVMLRVLDPGPKARVVIATGGGSGTYDAYAQTLVKAAADYGLEVKLRPDIEGSAALSDLLAPNSGVQGAVLKGGLTGSMQGRFAAPTDRKLGANEVDKLISLGRLFQEPVWVFYRGPAHVKRLREFKGRRISLGSAASGGRFVAAQLLRANGIDETNSKLIPQDLPDDAGPLIRGEVDVAFLIAPPEIAKVQRLLRVPGILLMDFGDVADAYVNRFPYLSSLVMREGSVEFAPELPSADITLLSTQPAFVMRKDTHPAIVSILSHVLQHNPKSGFDVDGEPILFYHSAEFPNAKDPELDVLPETVQAFKSGELPLLLRNVAPINKRLGIPFSVSAFTYRHGTQTLLLLIPLLSVLLPLFRILPMVYSWSIKQRLIFWYDKLKALETKLDADPSHLHAAEQVHELDRIDAAVKRLRVPLHASDQLYDLRGHIELVRTKIMPRNLAHPVAAQ